MIKINSFKKSRLKITLTIILSLIIIFIYNLTELIHDVSSMEYALRENDYPELLRMVKTNEVRNQIPVGDTAEYEALAFYYEALVYYRMYMATDEVKASEYFNIMKEWEKDITSDYMVKHKNELVELIK